MPRVTSGSAGAPLAPQHLRPLYSGGLCLPPVLGPPARRPRTSGSATDVVGVRAGEGGCVNPVTMVRSVYRWKGKVWNETEPLMILKTTHALLEDVRKTVKAFRSYELPEIRALPVTEGDRSALA